MEETWTMDRNVMFSNEEHLEIHESQHAAERESESWVKTKSACFVNQKNGHRAMCAGRISLSHDVTGAIVEVDRERE